MTLLKFEQLHKHFGARVTGMDLTRNLHEKDVLKIREAIDRYSVLCFPNQNMTDKFHLAITRALGEPEAEHLMWGTTGEVTYFGTVGNVTEDGTKLDNTHLNTHYQKGNEMWHSDSSFRETPSYVSILHGYEVPSEGGNTDFASMRNAYEQLSDVLRVEVDNLYAIHDYVFSRTQIAPVDLNHAASLPPVKHKLVRQNPNNGRKNLFLGSHARSILGYSGIKSRLLIDKLTEIITAPRNVYSHVWHVGDTIVWDNRCILHRGAGYDSANHRRYLRQTRVTGDEKGEILLP